MKVFIVNGSWAYNSLFLAQGWAIISDINQADLVLFTGGEDVSPHLYKEMKHPKTYNSIERDVAERRIFTYCVEHDIPMVGICRGGQFLNVMSGGSMFQHVTNHTRYHFLTDVESGEDIYVSSTHHQMMRPGPGAKVVAIAHEHGSKEHMGENGIIIHDAPDEADTEVVYYSTTDCLCFQPHPEFEGVDFHPMKKYFFGLIKKFFNLEVA